MGGLPYLNKMHVLYISKKNLNNIKLVFFWGYDNVVININVQCKKDTVEISLENFDIEFLKKSFTYVYIFLILFSF
jgi:hypothetical protein